MAKATMTINVYLNIESFPLHFIDTKNDRKHMEEFMEWFENGEKNTFKFYLSEERFYIIQRSAINFVDVTYKK